ncbi:MAG TPA: DinB family protein [Thermoanaerobaculia bacterium]|nr:DinB family protein [Thermoanaerobaculia bacterium]
MREIERILDQLNRSWGGPSWTGVDIQPLLDGISEEQARAHPLPNAHSILELTAHMTAWMNAVAARLGGDTRELTPEEDWRDVTQLTWPAAITEMENAQSHLSDVIARLTPDDLDKKVAGRKYTIYVMLHGVIQHNLYHAGQIGLLKKVG